ncbi:MAG TPA: DNA polymerase I [Anaerolineales bacterium]|nr:DNA polymerase I [Anaerolineales bacterium]
MPPTFYLIDGHALAYRMFFALTAGTPTNRWRTSTGEPTAGTYGFARELLRILEQEQPEYLAVAFDTGKTFRDQILPAYKGTRAKMPDELQPQIARIRQLVDAFNIPRLEMEGYEADDVLGSVARIANQQGLGVKIITGDRDLLQLVGPRTVVYLAGDDQNYITAEDVVRKLGVRPEQVVDYKAVVGDKSDNIPGVTGVGEKTAVTLLEKFGTLDGIYKNIDQVEKRWQAKLLAGKDAAYMSYDLARIRTDLPVQLELERARAHDFDPDQVEAFFQELEFRTLIKSLHMLTGQEEAPATARSGGPALSGPTSGEQLALFGQPAEVRPVVVPQPEPTIAVRIVDSPQALNALSKTLATAEIISFDTETTSVEEMQANIVGISLSVQPGEGYYLPVGHLAGNNLPIEQVIAALRIPFTDARIPKVAHHAKYDYIILARNGLFTSPIGFDTMIAEFIVDPSSRNLGLKNLAYARLAEEMTHIEQLIGTGKHQLTMAEIAIESAATYAAADAETTLRLMPLLQKELQAVNGQKLMDEIEMPLVSCLAEMEMSGVLLDLPLFEKMSKELGARMAEIEKHIFEAVGKPFNINSTQQLSDVLFNQLRLEPPDRSRKTQNGHFSTRGDILDALKGQHPVVDAVIEHRELSKLKSTYLDALPAAVDPITGRVHTSFSQTGAVTGRLSSSNPNLQNIPIRTEQGRRIRNGFIAPKGSVLLSVDYSQIELRIVAHMAKDEAMLAAFRAGQDIHAATAAAIYGVPLDQVNRDMRRHAKAINFGLIYGMSPFGLTRSTELTLAEAENFVKAYFQQFPGVKKYLDGIRKEAAQKGYVETLLGRRRYFPLLQSKINGPSRNREEREAINAPIQGTAADIMKLAMLHIPPALAAAGLHGRMLLQVHDELVLEVPKDELERTAKVVQDTMASAYPLDIPLLTDARYGPNWGEMTTVK